MAISFLTGKPGAGKGLLGMQMVVDELRNTQRPILTNIPVRSVPWVNGRGLPQLGLLEFLRVRYGQTFGAEWRVRVLDDEQAGEFFRYRLVGINGESRLEQAVVQRRRMKDQPEEKCPIESFDTELLSKGPHLYLIDEAWKFWGSRNWQMTGEGVLFYTAQHRHAGDDVFILTQHTKQIETAIQRVAQEFWVVRNRSMLRVGMFRQPEDFRVAVFDSAASTSLPMYTKGFKLDREGLAQTYDTTAGVGLSGRMVGDAGRRKKGIPFWGLVALGVLLPCLAFFIIHKVLGKGAKALVAAVVPGGAAVRGSSVSNSWDRGLAERIMGPKAMAIGHGGSGLGVDPGDGLHLPGMGSGRVPVRSMTGFVRLGREYRVFLSDGEIVSSLERGRHFS